MAAADNQGTMVDVPKPPEGERAILERIEEIATRLKDSGRAKQLLKARTTDSWLRVLAAEDDQMFGMLLKTSLAGQVKLEVATTGWRAAQLYLASPPDVLLLDLHLGDIHGRALLEALAAYDPSPYVIVISGMSYSTEVSAMLDCGAKGFVAKPFNLSMLGHHLAKAAMFRSKVPDPRWG